MTIRESILQKIGTLLNTSKPAGIPSPNRARGTTLDKTSLPNITFYALIDRVSPIHKSETTAGSPLTIRTGMLVKRELDVLVECTAKGSATVTPDEAVDVLTSWVEVSLAGGDWSGVAIRATPVQTEYEYGQAEEHYCQATVLMRVTYTSQAGNPTLRV